ncbi:MAG: Putative s-adenosyl-L-methionine-dependent methyltransferase, partial [Desulfotomaculum sp. 46_296]
ALAFAAWTYPGADGYRKLPKLQIACSGIAPNTNKKDWINLAGDNERFRNGLERLYDLFKDAPSLGSLIDPGHVIGGNLIKASFDELTPFLEKVMSLEKDNYELNELKVAACGITDAVQILNGRYHLIITNVPYLARGKQTSFLKEYCAEYYNEAKNDIATVFLDRLLHLNLPSGTTALVLPQNWLFLTTYKKFRTRMLKTKRLNIVVKLGPGAFETISGEVVNVALLVISNSYQPRHVFSGLDVAISQKAKGKAVLIRNTEIKQTLQSEQLKNPDSRVAWGVELKTELLNKYSNSYCGLGSGDYPRFGRVFWELPKNGDEWVFQLSTVEETMLYGRYLVFLFFIFICRSCA